MVTLGGNPKTGAAWGRLQEIGEVQDLKPTDANPAVAPVSNLLMPASMEENAFSSSNPCGLN